MLESAVTFKKNKAVEVLLGLDEYEEWTPAKVESLGLQNIGKKICIRNGRLTDLSFIHTSGLIHLYAQEDSIMCTYEHKIDLAMQIFSLNHQYEENPRNGYADFLGYIEHWGSSGQYMLFHITHILEK